MRLISLNWVVFLCLTPSLTAQPTATTNAPQREMSLQECIHLALEHNFSIQLEMIKPRVAQYDLSGSYALYEPTLDATIQHRYDDTAATFTSGVVSRGTKQKTDDFRAVISGELPTGLTYDLGLNMNHRDSEVITATANPQYGTNIFGVPVITNIVTTESPEFVDNYDTGIGVEIRQPLLRDFWISSTRAQIKINKGLLKISEEAVMYQTMQVVRDVEQAYYDLIAALDEVKVREMALELAQKLYDENRKRVLAGVLAPLDEKQAESEVAVAKADLIAARRQVEFRENVLKTLITDDYGQWHSVDLVPNEKLLASPAMFDRQNSWMNALSKRPDFTQARMEAENQGIRVKLGYNQLFPSLDLIAGGGLRGFDDTGWNNSFQGITDGEFPWYYVGATISVPLGNRERRYRYRSAKERLRETELLVSQLHQSIVVQVDDAITLAEANYQQIPARREARLFAEAALDAEQKKLENGKSTSFVVLQLQRDLTTARAAEIRALAEYNKALSDFYFSEGTILERNKIDVTFR